MKHLPSLATALALCTAVAALHAQGRPGGGNPLDQLPTPVATPALAPVQLQVEGQAPAGAAVGRADRTVTPSRFDIEGVTAIPFADVAHLFSSMAHQNVAVGRLVAVAAEATALYRASGHPLSFVFVPAQDFKDGVVRVVAVEGFIASVRIEGDAGPAESKLREFTQRLMREHPLKMASFERVSQLLTRVPGITLTAEAALPAGTDGATELVLKVKRQPYNVSLGADLRKPTPRAVLNGVLNDPLVPGGQLSASTLLSNFSKEKLATLGYTQLVGSDGLVIKGNYSDYRGYPDEQYGRGDSIERYNTNRRAELSASYPLILKASSSLTLDAGVYAVNNTDAYRVSQSGVTLTDETRVRALFAQLAWIETTAARARTASVLVAQGFRGAGAAAFQTSNTPGVAGQNTAKLDFTRVAFDASQRDRYANDWGTAISFGAQYSANTLAASERISFGGARFGRGYAPGDAAGDSGAGLGIELNREFKVDGGPWVQQVEPYVLYEVAQLQTEIGEPMPKRLGSAALGMRWSDRKHYSLDLALAKPTGDAALTNPQRRVRASLLLTYQLGVR
jgi:hemolysin activation/secretion protein